MRKVLTSDETSSLHNPNWTVSNDERKEHYNYIRSKNVIYK